jgi:alpha-beta hydrolase superfamily lysophospholipase
MPLKDFSYENISLADDYEGSVEAVFIQSHKNIQGQTPVLYLHGFVDYFFHPHLADHFHQHGYNFYAIELRKYGHAMLKHQHPNYCKRLEEYFEELDTVIEKIYQLDKRKLVFLGHSTGGLLASLYASYGNKKDLLAKLILNSPFLEINAPGLVRKLSGPIMKLAVKANPYANLPNALSPLYPQSLHKDYKGEWDFNLDYKPINGFPAYFQWLLAIKEGQDKVKAGLNIQIPILLLHSSDSFLPSKWSERIHKSDVVLNVEHMKTYGPSLGKDVQLMEIPDARHDIFLSSKEIREKAFEEMFAWLAEKK